MKQRQWLSHAADRKIHARILNDPILPLYGCLLAQFNRWTTLTWPDAVVGLHIVYCWMPTIPNLRLPANLSAVEQTCVVNLLNEARRRMLTSVELIFLKTCFCNNSVVGLSKLLHFIAPDRYAIWDRRVAAAWYAPVSHRAGQYTEPAAYLDYLGALQGWPPVRQATAIRTIRSLSPHLATVTDLRLLELVLFHV
jgi:hypothetical protein